MSDPETNRDQYQWSVVRPIDDPKQRRLYRPGDYLVWVVLVVEGHPIAQALQ